MTSQVFYRKWRPQTLAEVVGQPHVTQTLLNALKNGNISHAYLFCGPRGTGKTSTGRILAKAVNCLTSGKSEPCNTCAMCLAITEDRALDVIEIDAASNRGIDDIRDLREKVNYAPTQARRKVYIIDEFHMLSKDASNALLKTLEEPPPHVIFVLATTESHKVLPTILSRCQHFDFHRLSRADVVAQLTKISAVEKIVIDPRSLHLIARSSTGSLRDAENLLEQLTTYYGSDISFPQVQAMLGITGDSRAREIVKLIFSRDVSTGMALLGSVNNDGLDLRQFNRELVEYLRGLLLVKTGAADAIDLTQEDIAELKELAEKADIVKILKAIKLFGQIELGNNESSTLPLELALVDCYLEEAPPVAAQSAPAAPPVSRPSVVQAPYTPRPPAYKPEVKPPSAPLKSAAPLPAPASVKSGPPPASVIGPAPVDAKPESPRPVVPVAAAAGVKPEPAPKSPALPSSSLSSDIERLRLNWKQVIEGVDPAYRRSNALSLLRSGSKPVSIDSGVLTLAFSYDIHKQNCEKPDNMRIIEKIISDYLGHEFKVICVLDTKKGHLVNAVKKIGTEISGAEEK